MLKVPHSLLRYVSLYFTFYCALVVKNPLANAGDVRDGVQSLWNRKWQLTSVFLPGEFHGQRSPVGYSP